MDRWRSGTPETCHSSHHHAVCTRSPSFFLFLCRSFSLLLLLLYLFSFFPFIHSFTRIQIPQSLSDFLIFPSLLPLVWCQLLNNLSLFSSHHLSPSLPPFSLWQSFLGFIISSGDIPLFFSPFFPLSLSLCRSHSFFLSVHFHFQRLFFFHFSHLCIKEEKVLMEGWIEREMMWRNGKKVWKRG